MVHVPSAKRHDGNKRVIDLQSHGLGEPGQYYLLRRAFAEDDEARKIQLRISPDRFTDKLGGRLRLVGKLDLAHTRGTRLGDDSEMADILGLGPGKDAGRVAGDQRLGAAIRGEVVELGDDSGKIEGREVVLGLFQRDQGERRKRHVLGPEAFLAFGKTPLHVECGGGQGNMK